MAFFTTNGAKVKQTKAKPNNNSKIGFAFKPCIVIKTLPEPKIKTGIVNGKKINDIIAFLLPAPTIIAAKINIIEQMIGVPTNKDKISVIVTELFKPYINAINGQIIIKGKVVINQCTKNFA